MTDLRSFLFSTTLLISLGAMSQGQQLFENDSVLTITLRGNIKDLINDRGDNPAYHPLHLGYSTDTGYIDFPCRVRTRGHFRKSRRNCVYPPLMINLSKKDQPRSSLFYEQDKLKLVMPCQGDEYVVREWLVYKLYNLVTPLSIRARLVKVTLEETGGRSRAPLYGILLEDEKSAAARNGMVAIEKMGLRPEHTDRQSFLTMAVFEYLVGNTDWSVQYMQNVKFLAADSNSAPSTLPYDFDHAGIVGAPYARPAEELMIRSVRERRYRGFCIGEMKVYEPILDHFRLLKPAIYDLYRHCTLLNSRYVKATLDYLDEFYSTIDDPKAFAKDFTYPCDPHGTGNVVIKGIRDE